MAAGKSFAAVGVEDGLEPEVLPPFSMSSQDLPELADRATMNQLLGTAITTPVGTTSRFVQTDGGGFVLYIEGRPPIDQARMTADLPQFTAELRDRRQQEAFNQWLQMEGSRELRSTPLFSQMQGR
jgi:hypothetical protein